MRLPCLFNYVRMDPTAVVTNEKAQEAAQVLNFYFDICRMGVTQGVDDRFSTDQKELLQHCRLQHLRFFLNEDPKLSTPLGWEFVQKVRKRLLQARGKG